MDDVYTFRAPARRVKESNMNWATMGATSTEKEKEQEEEGLTKEKPKSPMATTVRPSRDALSPSAMLSTLSPSPTPGEAPAALRRLWAAAGSPILASTSPRVGTPTSTRTTTTPTKRTTRHSQSGRHAHQAPSPLGAGLGTGGILNMLLAEDDDDDVVDGDDGQCFRKSTTPSTSTAAATANTVGATATASETMKAIVASAAASVVPARTGPRSPITLMGMGINMDMDIDMSVFDTEAMTESPDSTLGALDGVSKVLTFD